MSTVKNSFKSKHDDSIKMSCDTKYISGKGTAMDVDLSSTKTLRVTKVKGDWPASIKAWIEDAKGTVTISADRHCEIKEEDDHWLIIPKKEAATFTVLFTSSSTIIIGDPDATITVGEEPPSH
ncbi:MAG: hypothetical protein GY765_35745 [bacterium]|nr:hypothetical protein [bacterium]